MPIIIIFAALLLGVGAFLLFPGPVTSFVQHGLYGFFSPILVGFLLSWFTNFYLSSTSPLTRVHLTYLVILVMAVIVPMVWLLEFDDSEGGIATLDVLRDLVVGFPFFVASWVIGYILTKKRLQLSRSQD